DNADLRDLVAQFPFPVMCDNFFGRFIAGGCDDPRKAIRYLRLCTPFFVRIRSLLEGLSNDRYRFLVIQGISAANEYEAEEEEDEAESPADAKEVATPAPAALERDAAELLHASINNAHDFVGGSDPSIPTPLVCIKMPELPSFSTDHIEKGEQARLAAELIDWLLTGDRDGMLLRRKSLSGECERDYRKTKRDLRQTRRERKKHHPKTPARQDN